VGDLEDFIDELADLDGEGLPAPTWRATIRRGQLTMTGWAPFLITSGPLGNLFGDRERAGVAIADLTILGDDADEISVRYWSPGRHREEADEVLATWAEDVGYTRLWLPDRVIVELERRPERLEGATVICPTCRARWSDATPEFWLTVRQAKAFPRWCPMCGCELPQWQVETPPSKQKPTDTRRGDRPHDLQREQRRSSAPHGKD